MVTRRLHDGFSRVLDRSSPELSLTVRWSNDGRYIASGGTSQITILNVRMGKCIRRQEGHNNNVRGLVFTPKGKDLVSASWDKMVIH